MSTSPQNNDLDIKVLSEQILKTKGFIQKALQYNKAIKNLNSKTQKTKTKEIQDSLFKNLNMNTRNLIIEIAKTLPLSLKNEEQLNNQESIEQFVKDALQNENEKIENLKSKIKSIEWRQKVALWGDRAGDSLWTLSWACDFLCQLPGLNIIMQCIEEGIALLAQSAYFIAMGFDPDFERTKEMERTAHINVGSGFLGVCAIGAFTASIFLGPIWGAIGAGALLSSSALWIQGAWRDYQNELISGKKDAGHVMRLWGYRANFANTITGTLTTILFTISAFSLIISPLAPIAAVIAGPSIILGFCAFGLNILSFIAKTYCFEKAERQVQEQLKISVETEHNVLEAEPEQQNSHKIERKRTVLVTQWEASHNTSCSNKEFPNPTSKHISKPGHHDNDEN